ncbi:MAG: hypothetical protein E2P03_04850 [Acidobacteria bacterium]|nr:MAG: hypothetical protein E2P03_04850 [Acidobacteriota bacterium]
MRSRRIPTRLFLSAAGLAVVLLATPDPLFAQRGPVAPDPGTIRLKTATFDPLVAMPSLPDGLSISEYSPGVRGSYLVQFDSPITAAHRSALENAGAAVKGYVPMMTLEVVMTPASRGKVAGIDGVRWVGVVQPAFKLYPGLERDVADRFTPGDKVALQVSLYPGEDEPGLSQVRGLGARILKVDRGRSFLVAQVEVPAARLQALARIPTVRYIELVYEPMALNDRARFHNGMAAIANDTFSAGIDPSLDGKDEASGFQVKYGHMDTGIYIAHPDFTTADITFEPGADSSDLDNGHGTHTSGSLVGDGGQSSSVPEGAPPSGAAIGPNQWRGMTPQAALHHISFDNLYTDRQMFERESEEGVQISSNSWGWSSGGSSIRDYNTNAAMWDEGVWDADNDVAGLQSLIVFFSAGNNGGFNSPYNGCISNGADNIGSPGTAKNVITVGNNETDRGAGSACGNFSGLGDNVEEMNASSSRGPVDPDGTGQGLFKPDVTNIGGYWNVSLEALGTASVCSGQTVSPDCPTYCSDTGASYAYSNGTSMSAPLTAGFGGVVLQDLVVNRGVATPRPSLIKALLINGARDLTPSACNYTYEVAQSVVHEGWGFVQAENTLYGPGGTPAVRNIEFENEETANALATGENSSRQVTVASGTPFRVSLVWTDYPAGAGSGSPLVVNDLDLEISGPDGTFLGNNFSGNWSVTGGGADRYNVVENVYIQNPTGGTYTITVKGFQVSQDQEPGKAGVNQDYSLAWSGDLSVCTPTCGDGVAECGEICDGTDLAGESCQSQGFDTGSLACDGTCDGFDTSACSNFVCGNGVREGSEECDGADLGGATCSGQGCTGGTPSCNGDCTLDISTCTGCPVCDNDGTCETGEDCNNCANDCISGTTPGVECGNDICETADGEDCVSCAADCNGKQNGKPSNRFCCGDGGTNPVGCGTGECDTGGNTCTTSPTTAVSYCCGDTVCEGEESSANCAVDCGALPFCGDGTCNGGETVCDCAVDCGPPAGSELGLCTDSLDNDCDGPVDCADSDCAADAACVGCSLAQVGESCVDDADCCSDKCKGKSGAKTCK